MGIVKCRGQLKHRFWGTYSAVIGLVFDNGNEAREALATIGAPFEQSEREPRALICCVNSEQLNAVKETLGRYGADVSKIDSIARSIDYGEPFACLIPVTPSEQTALFA